MLLSKTTIDVLSNFSKLNTNLLIRKGSILETITVGKDIIARYESQDNFDTQVGILNLNEFLGVLSVFTEPELTLDTKFMNISQGKESVRYVYAEESSLFSPSAKPLKFPVSDIHLQITSETFNKIQKVSGIINADEMAIIGDGKNISIKIFNKKNPSANVFDIDTGLTTSDKFRVVFKIEKLKVLPGNYTVDIAQKISRFTNDLIPLIYYIAIESDSVFPD